MPSPQKRSSSFFKIVLAFIFGWFSHKMTSFQIQLGETMVTGIPSGADTIASEVGLRDSSVEVQTEIPDTSIILLTNLVPLHPNITQTTTVLESAFKYLEGLPPTTPVFIAVDFLVEPDSVMARKHNYASNNEKDRNRLQQYISNLRAHYLPMKNVQIVPAVSWGMINYNIGRALEVVETKYIYVMQHDFAFKKPIDHKAIVKTFDEYYPEHIWKLEFAYKPKTPWATQSTCYGMTTPVQDVNGIHTTKQSTWTDQNHFTTKEHYLKVLEDIGPSHRTPEHPMNTQAVKNCVKIGTHLYGPDEEGYLDHLNGRFTKSQE